MYLTSENANNLEINFFNTVKLHGITQSPNLTEETLVVSTHIRKGTTSALDGIRIDTAANKRSVTGKVQHEAYQK